MNGEAVRLDPSVGVPPLEALVDPVVRSACRSLARLRYPVADLAPLPRDEGGSLVRALFQPRDLPLTSLREALDTLDLHLRAPPPPPIFDTPTAPLDPVPERLAGADPATRASRRVYRGILSDPDLAGLDELARQRLAYQRAHHFKALCEATLPRDRYQGPRANAALHAWAQCYAREYLASSRTMGPSRCCDGAAQMAEAMARRAEDGQPEDESDLAG